MQAAENYAPEVKKPSFVQEMLGQLARWEFWKGMLKTLIHEAVLAGLYALGTGVVWYVRERKGKDGPDTMSHMPGAGTSAMATRAFGNDQFSPNPGYRPSYPIAPVPTAPAGPDRFPGF